MNSFARVYACLVLALLPVCGFSVEPQVTQVIQFGMQGSGDSEFMFPYGIAIQPVSGDIFVCDTGNNAVKQFSPLIQFIGSFGQSGTGQGQFRAPQSLAFSPVGDYLYVLDTGNQRVQKFDMRGEFPVFERLWGGEGTGNGQFNFPRDISVGADGSVYVLDSGNARIQKFSPSGAHIATLGESLDVALANPYGLCVDNIGDIYIADMENSRVLKINPAGEVLLNLDCRGGEAGQFLYPRDVIVDTSGSIFVADTDNFRIEKFDAAGRYLQQFGVFIEFFSPESLAFSPAGRLYVVDSNTHRVQAYDVLSLISKITLLPSIFTPDGDGINDQLSICFNLNEPAIIGIKVYDEGGALVKTVVDDETAGTFHAMQLNGEVWDGTNDDGLPVLAGVYEVRIEAVSASGYRAPVQIIYVTIEYPENAPDLRVTPAYLRFTATYTP